MKKIMLFGIGSVLLGGIIAFALWTTYLRFFLNLLADFNFNQLIIINVWLSITCFFLGRSIFYKTLNELEEGISSVPFYTYSLMFFTLAHGFGMGGLFGLFFGSEAFLFGLMFFSILGGGSYMFIIRLHERRINVQLALLFWMIPSFGMLVLSQFYFIESFLSILVNLVAGIVIFLLAIYIFSVLHNFQRLVLVTFSLCMIGLLIFALYP